MVKHVTFNHSYVGENIIAIKRVYNNIIIAITK